MSSQTQVSLLWMLPLQGDWCTCFTAVMVMSDTAALVRAKGTLIHCRQRSHSYTLTCHTHSTVVFHIL